MTKLLAIGDIEDPYVYSALNARKLNDIDFTISCGDLPDHYLEYIISLTNKRLYFVQGNHLSGSETGRKTPCSGPPGGIDLHLKTKRTASGFLLAGIEGSVLYNYGPCQYSQGEMWLMVFRLLPGFWFNFLRFGRFLDILVTHAPPWKINDQNDLPHQGIKAFRWLIRVFKPAFHLHGHTRDYLKRQPVESVFGGTRVINVTGYKIINFNKKG